MASDKRYAIPGVPVAMEALAQERHRAAVEEEKERLRKKKSLLHKLFPFKISFTRG
jgi:hypothetical protein